MRKKRIVIFLIALNLILLSIFMISIKTYADEQISVSAETNSSMEQGSSAYCYVKISSLENVSSINISVYFDSDKIEVINTYNNVSISLYDSSINDDNVNYSYIFDGNGEVTETSLFYFYYKVKDDSALGNTYFDIIVTDALDTSLNELNVKGNRCNINVIEKKASKTCYVYNNTNSINTKIGQEFEVKYYFSTYDIASGSMNITYDYDLFELKSYSFGHFFDEKIKDINNSLNGSIYISFLGTEQTYNTDIITLTFSPKKNVTETSVISNSVTDLYDNDLNIIKCSSTNITVNLIKDESYIEDAPRMYLNASMQNNNSQCLLTIKLDENSNLGAGDFTITFDTNYLTYNSSNKILSATYFNVNDKKIDEGIVKFSIISLDNITSETDVLNVLFDIEPICSDQLVDFDITASGLSDSLTNPIMLNMVGLNYELISNGHQYGEWTVTTEPTFDNTGLLTKVCQNNNEHTETYVLPKLDKDDYTYKVETNPKCTLTGKDSYTIIVDGQIFKFEIITEALGHTHSESVKENNVKPTCETDGHYDSVVYCSECGEELSRDTITVNKLGHNYNYKFDWDNDLSGATLTLTCQNDNSHTFTIHLDSLKQVVSVATATEKGKNTYTVSYTYDETLYEDSKDEIIPELGHIFTYGGITWNEDYTAYATFTCTTEEDHVETINAVVTLVTTNPTCVVDGLKQYTATVSFNGKNYTDTKNVVLNAPGHTTGEDVKENNVNPTCETDGHYDSVVYCSECGEELSRDTITVNKLGHNYGEWNVTINPKLNITGLLTKVCQHDNTHVETYVLPMLNDTDYTYKVESNPTCLLTGKDCYTIIVDGQTFKFEVITSALGHIYADAVKENDVPTTCEADGHYDMVVYCSVCGAEISRTTHIVNKLGHNYGEVTYTWNDNKCTATRVCQNDNTHVETEIVTGTYVKVSDATCTLNETGKYVATFENVLFEAQESEVFEVMDTKLGHNYGDPEFVWDGYTAKAVFTCTIDESHKEEIQAVITNTITKESTINETGIKLYTATVTFNNQTYTSTKEEILDKLDPIVELKKVIDSMSKTDSAEVLQAKLAQANQLYSLIENKESVQEEYNTLEEYQNYYESITNPNNDSKSNGLSGGAIAGIIAGSVAVIAAIIVGGFFILKKKKSV